ncbi:hypothetical protein Q5P01_011724 [Channa striata]|uniref:C-type lectin domain-containing protein n=1 Tax=Channa striata TaxID=64152 RepID=A0AA88SN63_CHASR|nr:hypothetical protein Q5P01_011724 [Channa striata]
MDTITHVILHLSGLCSLCSCVSDYTYILFKNPRSWFDAQSFCRLNCYNLVTVTNASSLEQVLRAAEAGYDDAAWIGLKSQRLPEYYWSLWGYDFYKREAGYTLYWASNPTNECASYVGGLLYDHPCSTKLFSMCFDGSILRIIKMRISSQASVLLLNDPAVQGNILKQIKQELSNNNATDVVRLNWKTDSDGEAFTKEPDKEPASIY